MKGEIYNKRAKRVRVEGIWFDSKLEAGFYSRLIKLRELKVHVSVHYPLVIQGKVWRVDFALFPLDGKAEEVLSSFGGEGRRLFVEIKGAITRSFIAHYQKIIDTPLDRETLILSDTYKAILYPPSAGRSKGRILGLPEVRIKVVYPLGLFFKVLREKL